MSITIKGLSHYYPNGKKALDDISLEIPSGMFGLLGPNGAGKSTLMRILVTLLEPSEGQVNVCGYDIRTQRKEVRRILGYLPQDFRFFARYKVREFLDYAAALTGMTNSQARGKAVDAMLEQVGLYEVRDRYAQNLSGGMKRRLGIAQALIHKPMILVVDEPTTGLDPEERIRFRNLLSEASTKDTTIILSTHIVGDISSSCTEMAMLNQGHVMFRGVTRRHAQGNRGQGLASEGHQRTVCRDKSEVCGHLDHSARTWLGHTGGGRQPSRIRCRELSAQSGACIRVFH